MYVKYVLYCFTCTGINLAIYDLFEMTCLTSLHCNIYGNMDCTNLCFLGFTTKSAPSAPDELILPGDETMAVIEQVEGLNPNKLHDRQKKAERINNNKRITNSDSTENKLYTVLDYFPSPGVSYFFTFLISGKSLDRISMDLYEPIHIDTLSPSCTMLMPSGSCVTGTPDGTLVEWDVTTQATIGFFTDCSTGGRVGRHGSHGRPAHEAGVMCVEAKADLVASGDSAGIAKVWSINNSRQLVHRINLNSHSVSMGAVSISKWGYRMSGFTRVRKLGLTSF